MAEILIRATDNTSGHPLAWKRGMPVAVMPDGHPWSARERLAPANGGSFVILKITDVTIDQVLTFFQARWGLDLCDLEHDPIVGPARRRTIRVRLDDLPPAVRNELQKTGTYTTTWTAIRSFCQRILTGENA